MLHEPPVIGLVEDDPIMGESLAQRLGLEGMTVHWWRTGREAVADRRLSLHPAGGGAVVPVHRAQGRRGTPAYHVRL